MSFNLNTKVNNLQWQINQIVAGSVTNPLTSNLNANNKSITNCNTISSVSGSPLNLSAGSSTVNVASAVNMVDTLTINNNTVHNGLVVTDSAGDTSCFVIDQSGNCGIKVNPVDTLTADFVVNGNANVSGSVTVNTLNATTINGGNVLNNITAGTGLIKTGTSTNPTLSNTGVLGVSAGSSGISVSGTAQNPVINNTGVLGVSAGSSGISITGTSQNPIINNTGVTQLTAGSNISLSGSTGNITISASSTPAYIPKLGSVTFGFSGAGFPISAGGSGYWSMFFNGQIINDLQNGVSDPNGSWLIFLSGFNFIFTGNNNDGAGIFLSDALDGGSYAINSGNAVFSAVIAGANNRILSCPPIVLPVNAVRSALPNLWQNVGVRFNITNLTSSGVDQIFPQSIPLICYAQYFPNGVQ